MSFWLEPELQQYFDINASGLPPLLRPPQQPSPPPLSKSKSFSTRSLGHLGGSPAELKASVAAALADDPALAFLLRLDSALGCRDGVVTCLATVRRNVQHQELQYLQRFKQIAEPAIRHPAAKEQILMCLDPRTLRCGQQVLLKVQTRSHPAEPLQLLREWAVLRAAQDPPAFPKAYLFGCLGSECWRVTSEDRNDERQFVMHRQHFLLCQYVEDSLQRVIDANRTAGQSLDAPSTVRTCREMLNRLDQLHSIGWSHGCLQPSCFLLLGGDDLLLSDFSSAEPLERDCLIYRGERERSLVYGSARFSASSKQEAAFADFESLVYIVCSLMSPKPLPWELAEHHDATAVATHKLALWQFVEAESETVGADLWREWRLDEVFNCSSSSQVGELPAFRLASGIVRLHRERTGSEPPSCPALVESLR